MKIETGPGVTPAKLGRYEITGKLGEGAMGVVYHARDPLIERPVAIKTVSLNLPRDERGAFEQRFYREARSAGGLNHANIVTIYDVGKSGDFAYIAMEFLKGRSLRDILDSGVVLCVEQAVDIAAQVAEGLAFAHEHGVIHRDIKPANIVILENGTAKITDFGIALVPAGSRTLTATFGSPKYMAPEQVAGQQADARSDIFSLGAVLYEMLTGVPPFSGDHLDTILYRVMNEIPPLPSERSRFVPPSLDRVVTTALGKRPEDRHQSSRELAADLDRHERRRFVAVAKPVGVAIGTSAGTASGDATVVINRSPLQRRLEPHSSAPVERGGLSRSWRREIGLGALLAGAVFIGTVVLWPQLRSSKITAASTATDTSGKITASPRQEPPPASQAQSEIALQAVPSVPQDGQEGEERPEVRPAPRLSAGVQAAPISQSRPETAPEAVPPAPKVPPQDEQRPIMKTPPKAPTAAVLAGRLTLAVSPWGEVFVDGRKRGLSPPVTEVVLSPGKHTVEIRNSNFPTYGQSVHLQPNETVRIKYKFE
jgi:serine/threonine-protein kinase